MSTSALIIVIDKVLDPEGSGCLDDELFSIYRHADGYPEGDHGVIAGLGRVLDLAWPLPRFEAADFAAAIVAAWKTRGGHIYLANNATNYDCNFTYRICQCEKQRDHLQVDVYVGDAVKPAETHYLPAVGPLGKLAIEGVPRQRKRRVKA